LRQSGTPSSRRWQRDHKPCSRQPGAEAIGRCLLGFSKGVRGAEAVDGRFMEHA
jgi:hypothetical protein